MLVHVRVLALAFLQCADGGRWRMHLEWKRVCCHSKVQHSSVCLIVVKSHSCGELKMRRTQGGAGIAVHNPALSYWTPC